jgi:hypothetical protein
MTFFAIGKMHGWMFKGAHSYKQIKLKAISQKPENKKATSVVLPVAL